MKDEMNKKPFYGEDWHVYGGAGRDEFVEVVQPAGFDCFQVLADGRFIAKLVIAGNAVGALCFRMRGRGETGEFRIFRDLFEAFNFFKRHSARYVDNGE